MVSIEQLINALNVEQVSCSRLFPISEKKEEISILDKYIVSNKFDFINTELIKFYDYWILKKRHNKDTFLYSILLAIDENFRYISEVKQALKNIKYQMWIDLDEKNKYRELGYNFNRKMNRNILREYFEGNADTDKEEQCLKYVVDYFPIQCYIIDDNNEKIGLGNFKDKRKNCPIIFLKKEKDKYYPLLGDKNGIFSYTHNLDIEPQDKELQQEELQQEELQQEELQQEDLQQEELQQEELQQEEQVEMKDNSKTQIQPKPQKKYTLKEISSIAKENKIVLSYINKEENKRVKKTLQQLIDECKEKKII